MKGRTLLFISIACLAAAYFVAPESKSAGGVSPTARVLRTALGPLRAPAASLLRLHAAFARGEGDADESIRIQQFALEIDHSTEAALSLASELAYDIPSSGLSSASSRECARLAIETLKKARDLGNNDPRLLDLQAELILTKRTPAPIVTKAERRAALDEALVLAEMVIKTHRAGNLRASMILSERGDLEFAERRFDKAARDFRAAAGHEEILAHAGFEDAHATAALYLQKAALGDALHEGAGAEAVEKIFRSIREMNANDPVLTIPR
ncbi:MAG: hypothetical protein ACKVS6_09865 [Planctomycetota bacterium]